MNWVYVLTLEDEDGGWGIEGVYESYDSAEEVGQELQKAKMTFMFYIDKVELTKDTET